LVILSLKKAIRNFKQAEPLCLASRYGQADVSDGVSGFCEEILVVMIQSCDKLTGMSNTENLSYMATLYMALADPTRLRLLNLMHDQEVCVGYFIEVLDQSQPKISRHLAYLRNAGIVDARRDGKWIHYRIRWPEDEGGRGLLKAALAWLGNKEELQMERQKYEETFGFGAGDGGAFRNTESFISAEPDIYETEPQFDNGSAAHNDLEEFLL
jgi:ArsR family transcriptional regulator